MESGMPTLNNAHDAGAERRPCIGMREREQGIHPVASCK